MANSRTIDDLPAGLSIKDVLFHVRKDGTDYKLNGNLINSVQSIAYAAAITPSSANGKTVTVNVGTLTGNITINNPSGTPEDGQVLSFRFEQDGTGGHATSWGAAFAFGTDVTTALIPTTANAKYEIAFKYHNGDSKWRAMAIIRGF